MSVAIEEARQLAAAMMARQLRVVFAESCTAGLVSALVSRTPGISEFLCGSAVAYRERTKQDWLGVASADLVAHSAVSVPVARQMALGAIEKTAEADWAAAITGHLGPQSPTGLDGVVYIALAERAASGIIAYPPTRHALAQTDRVDRQSEAAALVMRALRAAWDK